MSLYQRLTGNGVVSSENPAHVWENWHGNQERWLFVAPHDDDIILGAGLTFLAGLADGIDTYAAVTTNGGSGYCKIEHRGWVAGIRKAEVTDSFSAMGLPASHLFFLNYHDCGLEHFTGHFSADDGGATAINGSTGLSNSYTWLLRQVKPTRVFIPSNTDIHPDHMVANREMQICLFHAQGSIWPELGEPITEIPMMYEYATYSDFLTPPDIRITVSEALLAKKLAGISAYKSQEQIGQLIEIQKQAGCRECLRTKKFDIMVAGKYDYLFDQKP